MLDGVAAGSWLSPAAIANAVGGRVVRTGRSAVRVVTDSRDARAGDLFIALRGERFDAHDFVPSVLRSGVAGVLVDRPLADRVPPGDGFVVRVKDTGAALLALGHAHRQRHEAVVVGVTGSCGKTGTKDMLGQVLSTAMPTVWSPKSFNNQIGVPLSLLAVRPETRAAVIEIGSNAPGEIAALAAVAAPDIAIVTCVREAHLAGFGDLAGVAREKAALPRSLGPVGVAILNADDPSCVDMAGTLHCATRWVSTAGEADWFATEVRSTPRGMSFLLNGVTPVTLPRFGEHNVGNALLCVAAAAELGMRVDAIATALARATPSARRFEPKYFGGCQIVDDTYNMSPASARAALDTIAKIDVRGRRFVAFGEMLELGPRSREMHVELGAHVAHANIDVLLTVGGGAEAIADGAVAQGFDPARVLRLPDVDAAIATVRELLAPGDLLLCKASHGVRLDRLVDALEVASRSGSPEPQAVD